MLLQFRSGSVSHLVLSDPYLGTDYLDGRAYFEESQRYVELSGDSLLHGPVNGAGVWKLRRRIGAFFLFHNAPNGQPYLVFSVDINSDQISEKAKSDPNIRFLTLSSTDERVKDEIAVLRSQYKGRAFFVLDSDHSKYMYWRI